MIGFGLQEEPLLGSKTIIVPWYVEAQLTRAYGRLGPSRRVFLDILLLNADTLRMAQETGV